jgi:hypothetical protein
MPYVIEGLIDNFNKLIARPAVHKRPLGDLADSVINYTNETEDEQPAITYTI